MRTRYELKWQSTDQEEGEAPGLAEIGQALAETAEGAPGDLEDQEALWREEKKRLRSLSGRMPWVLFTLTQEDQDGNVLRAHALEGRIQEVRGETVFSPPSPERLG